MELAFKPLVTSQFSVAESPIWCADAGLLYWVDIPNGHLHACRHDGREHRHWELGEPLGCVGLVDDGQLVLGLQSGFALFDTQTQTLSAIGDPEKEKPTNRFNDGAMSRDGRFFSGTLDQKNTHLPNGALYRLDGDGTITTVETEIRTTNGLAFNLANNRLYVSDSSPLMRTIWAYDYDESTGSIANRRVFFAPDPTNGRPDGGYVDAEDHYWMAGIEGGNLVRLTPDGKIDSVIAVPVARPTKICLGGPDLTTLYVTSLADDQSPGQVFAAQSPFKGNLEPKLRLLKTNAR